MSMKSDMAALIESVTKSWTEAKRKVDRNYRVSQNRIERMRSRPPQTTVREVAFAVMEAAYNKASSNGQYYANARQIMYAARPAILAATGADRLSDRYFTQVLLKDYIEEYDPDWKVVWDARGHLVEPHTRRIVALGGHSVTRYMSDWGASIRNETPRINPRVDTHGPEQRFGNVLFIEKEGFSEILEHAGIAKRYDMAIMSTKGVPVAAACDLINKMDSQGVRVFCLHDFDRDGFKIARTLREGTRLSLGTDVIDLGLRMADIGDLPSEPVSYSQHSNPQWYLEFDCGATPDEYRFLVSGGSPGRWSGRRVEINAMTSEQMIAWLERKFAEHEVKKVIPDEGTLNAAYRRAELAYHMEAEVERLREEMEGDMTLAPEDLEAMVKALLTKDPLMSWDEAVWQVAWELNYDL